MKDFVIGFVGGTVLELFALSEVYKILIPQTYISANATLFLLVIPALLVLIAGSWLWFAKKRPPVAVGLLCGFGLCFLAFLTLIGLGGGM